MVGFCMGMRRRSGRPTKEIKYHYARVADLGCVVCHSPIVALHHCFGGSCTKHYGLKSQSSRGISDWLVIPISPLLHTNGPDAIHTLGARQWEEKFGDTSAIKKYVSIYTLVWHMYIETKQVFIGTKHEHKFFFIMMHYHS